MRFKVRGAISSQCEEPLCRSCVYSTIIRGRKLSEEIVTCSGRMFRDTLRITFPVTSCSEYIDKRQPSMMQMMENAWVLRRGTKQRPAGFVHGRDLRAEEIAQMMGELHAESENE